MVASTQKLTQRKKTDSSSSGKGLLNGSYAELSNDGTSYLNGKKFKGIGLDSSSSDYSASYSSLNNNRDTSYISIVLTLISFITRFYALTRSNKVVWDEAHFGKFLSYYIKREFYFDVHPPLGKVLLGLSGWIAGYDGNFMFESGKEYPQNVPFGFMRAYCAFFGALMVPLAYRTALALRFHKSTAIFMSCLVITDLALLNISRFILLDSLLLFFTCLSAFCLVRFRNEQNSKHFTLHWWLWLTATGFSLGCVLSVKWVGLFVIALAGWFTLEDLWDMFGDLNMPVTKYLKHWAARIICLICLPMAVYMFSFYIHFQILNRSGTGDAHMSSLFQASLEGNSFDSNPLDVAYGSLVTFKSNSRGGGLLHSHVQRFPAGSEQQQVTCYHHKDNNNDWTIESAWDVEASDNITFVKNEDIVRLLHVSTGRNLHSHPVEAPITKTDNEVSCYGNKTFGDSNDLWEVEIVDDFLYGKTDHIRSLSTRFRLKHKNLGCYLKSHAVTLPEWGFKQAEVICEKKGDPNSPSNMWNVEKHVNSKLPPAGAGVYKSSFLKDFVDLNVAMWTSNNALTPDPEKEPDAITSKPWEWPVLARGLRMCGWSDENVKYYLVGHPFIWWGSSVSILLISGWLMFYAIRYQRQYRDSDSLSFQNNVFAGKVGLLGWVLHYLPFWIMGRVTYLHHYFPALYFGIICFSFMLDRLTSKLSDKSRSFVIMILLGIIIAVFIYFLPLALGFRGPAVEIKGRQWLKKWRLYNAPDDPIEVEAEDEEQVIEVKGDD